MRGARAQKQNSTFKPESFQGLNDLMAWWTGDSPDRILELLKLRHRVLRREAMRGCDSW